MHQLIATEEKLFVGINACNLKSSAPATITESKFKRKKIPGKKQVGLVL